MPKFGTKAKPKTPKPSVAAKHPLATLNYEGGLAFSTDPAMELYLRAASTLFGEPKFYDPTAQGDWVAIPALVETVSKSDPEFPLQLARYCRNVLNLRSVSTALLVESCHSLQSRKFARSYAIEILRRADELTEAVAYWNARYGGALPRSLRGALADGFHRFTEYDFAKYDRDSSAVKFRDVMNVAHPKPKGAKERALFKRIHERTLKTPTTWETVISEKGSTKAAWTEVLPDMGFMARIRNLRNLLQKKVDVSDVVRMLNDADAVRKSRQFPYRLYSAYTAVEGVESAKAGKVLDALETAIALACENLPDLRGRTAIVVDLSGSMLHSVSKATTVKVYDIGALFGAMAHRICEDSVVIAFGEKPTVVNVRSTDGVFTNMKRIQEADVGDRSTKAHKVIEWMTEDREKFDRILFFSDMQCYNQSDAAGATIFDLRKKDDRTVSDRLREYRRRVNPKARLYSFDLTGYGTTQVPQDDPLSVLIGGWSERVLSFVHLFEKAGPSALDEVRGFSPASTPSAPAAEAEV
jgi:60 kDa SS-A/Ro ribonucleoprotein